MGTEFPDSDSQHIYLSPDNPIMHLVIHMIMSVVRELLFLYTNPSAFALVMLLSYVNK